MTKEIVLVSSELQKKIKACNPDVKDFIRALQSELLKLHRHNLGLEAKNISLNARIKALDEELNPFRQTRQATDEELKEGMKEILSEAIKKKNSSGGR